MNKAQRKVISYTMFVVAGMFICWTIFVIAISIKDIDLHIDEFFELFGILCIPVILIALGLYIKKGESDEKIKNSEAPDQ